MSIVKVENLTKVYGKGATATRALDDVSLTIRSALKEEQLSSLESLADSLASKIKI